MPSSDYMKLTGIGFALPDIKKFGICNSKKRFWEIIKNGECVLSKTPEYQNYDIGVAGKIHNWQRDELNISEKYIEKYSKATLLGILATKKALEDAEYSSKELSNARTLLVVASTMLTLETVNKQFTTLFNHSKSKVGFDFFIQGTPGSIACGISKVLELDCPVLTLTGSCASTLNAIQLASEKLLLNYVDKVIIVGVDDSNDPLYFSSVSYQMKTKKTIAAITDNPLDVRPHDMNTKGNACGQGAIAIIMEREDSKNNCSENTQVFRLHYSNSRRNGHGMFDCGNPDNFGKSVKEVLKDAKIGLGEVGFINDFAEGADFIEEFFIQALNYIRKENEYDGEIYLTNQEAAFGHIGGIAGILKLVCNLMMMNEGIITPSINCEKKFASLCATPIIKKYIEKKSKYSMLMSCGAGGDCSIMLIEDK